MRLRKGNSVPNQICRSYEGDGVQFLRLTPGILLKSPR